jgi:eukaryotic-like serine/threonine-protein kinase
MGVALLPPGALVGDYQVVRCVTESATSFVYEGRHATQGHAVALKVMHPKLCLMPELMARFLNEARTLQALHHPHLVRGLDQGMLPEGLPFMVLEWHPEDLERALLRWGGPLSAGESAQIIWQLADALSLLHSRGTIHRDLKPANVLVAHREPGNWKVLLSDLGLAKRLLSDAQGSVPVSTARNELLGSEDYMPGEQWINAKNVDARADLYALGILWFQLLTGRLPFVASAKMGLMFCHLNQRPPLDLLSGRAPEATRSMIARMLAKKREERPSLEDVVRLLNTPEG